MDIDRETRSVPRSAAGRWTAAGLDAIHAGISGADAVLIASTGRRSVAKDHSEVIGMLEAGAKSLGATHRRQLTGLLKMNGIVEYDQRLLTEVEARQLVDQASRFVAWSAQVVTDHVK